MKTTQTNIETTLWHELDEQTNDPNQTLWTEIDDDVAVQLAGGVKVKGWAKCQVPGKCEAGLSIVVKF